MTDLVESPAAPPGPASDPTSAHPTDPAREAAPRPFVVGAWLLCISAVVCVLVYLGIAAPGAWFTSARAQHWTPSQMVMSRGSGQLRGDVLQLNAPDASATTVVSLSPTLRSSQYPVIAWHATGIPDGVEVALLWHNDYAPARVFNRRLNVEGGRIQPFSLDADPNWNGTINGLAVGFKGPYAQPILISGATAKTMSAREILGDRAREWLTFEPWSGSSINLIIGGSDTQDLPMPFIFAAIVGLAALIYAALARWRPRWVGSTGAIVVGGVFVAAWFLLDARLQWNLLRQARVTAETYAGKSWRDRHLAAEDGMVFAFIEKVRAKLPPPPARVFMVADEHYFRDRGAYHLYPYNVFFSPWFNAMPPSSALRSGDYLVVFQRRGVQFDPVQQSLRWEGQTPVRAELMLVEGGAAMFRVL
ncbi:MAG: hypothetical protein ABI981_05155 [Betaproteobacteria bacterium]